MQKGAAHIFVLLGVLFIATAVSSYWYFNKPAAKVSETQAKQEVLVQDLPSTDANNVSGVKTTPKDSPKEDNGIKTYINEDFNFQFQYQTPQKQAMQDSEEEFNKRGGGDFRKNFKGYVGYEPGKVLGAYVVLDNTSSFDKNPFTVWIFDNPEDLTIDRWHHNFWYYPFVWGDFTSEGKFDLTPKEEATVSGQTGKGRVIDYQPGKPKFIYISKDKRMYLFRVIGSEGEKILETFKFL